MNLEQRFLVYHKKNATFQSGDRILVALSGGKDSVCLLHLLNRCGKEWNLHIAACHIHHGIRGAEADRDEEFCRALCHKLGIEYFCKQTNVPRFCREQKIGLEEGARILRYRLLNLVAENNGFNRIATAHSASDQAETVLFHLIRGSGFYGTCGIHSLRNNLCRPLLPFYEKEILKFCRDEHLNFTKDSSNFDITISRNRIRHRIIPEIEQINPAFSAALLRFSAISAWQKSFCEKVSYHLLSEQEIDLKNEFCPLPFLQRFTKDEADYPILYTILSNLAKSKNESISFERFLALISLLKSPIEGKIIQISHRCSFWVQGDKLRFGTVVSGAPCPEYRVFLKQGDNSITQIGQILTISEEISGKISNINKKLLIIEASSDKIKGGMFARNIREGDRIRMNQMTKSVKKLLCDSKIPRDMRKQIPLICDEEEILWIPLVGLCDKCRNPESNKKIRMTLSGNGLKEFEKTTEGKNHEF